MRTPMPLYDSRYEHDACGVGFIASRDSIASHRMTRLAVDCLRRLDHRGAKAADGTGDGAGLLVQVPGRLLRRDLTAAGLTVGAEPLGVVMCFLPTAATEDHRRIVDRALFAEGLRVIHWRPVPTDPSVLSVRASESMPVIEQADVVPASDQDLDEFERSLYLARKAIERTVDNPGFSIPSASARTVVYKGLFTAAEIGVLSLAATVWQDAHLHGSAHRGLTKLRALADDYDMSKALCSTHRLLFDRLGQFEAEMHQHVHKENNVLFPKTLAREADLNRSANA